jgi:hypothetical protein
MVGNPHATLRAACLPVTLIIFVMLCLSVSGHAQSMSQDPGHLAYVSIRDLRFSCPNGFDLQRQQATDQIAYIPDRDGYMVLFVVLPDKRADDGYLKQLAAQMAAYLLPQEKPNYSWKKLDDYSKISKFEVGGGAFQGFNGQQRVQADFRRIKVKDKEAVIGFVLAADRGQQAKMLFERNLGIIAFGGLNAQAHVIASLTGEKYEAINPEATIEVAPVPKRKN